MFSEFSDKNRGSYSNNSNKKILLSGKTMKNRVKKIGQSYKNIFSVPISWSYQILRQFFSSIRKIFKLKHSEKFQKRKISKIKFG